MSFLVKISSSLEIISHSQFKAIHFYIISAFWLYYRLIGKGAALYNSQYTFTILMRLKIVEARFCSILMSCNKHIINDYTLCWPNWINFYIGLFIMLMFLYPALHPNLAIFYVCIVSTQFHFLLDPNSSMPTQFLSVTPHTCAALNFLKNLKDCHHPSSCSRDDMQLVQWVLGIWRWKDTPEEHSGSPAADGLQLVWFPGFLW